MKNKSIAYLKRKADALYQKVVLQDCKKCVSCGRLAEVAHHYIPKSRSNNLRYYLPNGIPLCNSCHFLHHQVGEPMIAYDIEQSMGQEWREDLQKRRHVICKLTKTYLQEVIQRLEGML